MALIDNENRLMAPAFDGPTPAFSAASNAVDSVHDHSAAAHGHDPLETEEEAPRIPLAFDRLSPKDMREKAASTLASLRTRRSVREFSTAPIDLEVVRTCIDTAAQAPSGAHKQPWTFVLVTDPKIKREIRVAAEAEEQEFYESRAPKRWLDDLKPFATNPHKPFLEEAPALIVAFAQRNGEDGARHYYVQESVGIAVGFLISALHQAGLATLTHTPSPMKFLSTILERPENERPYLLLPVGLPKEGCEVPAITRKDRAGYLVEK